MSCSGISSCNSKKNQSVDCSRNNAGKTCDKSNTTDSPCSIFKCKNTSQVNNCNNTSDSKGLEKECSGPDCNSKQNKEIDSDFNKNLNDTKGAVKSTCKNCKNCASEESGNTTSPSNNTSSDNTCPSGKCGSSSNDQTTLIKQIAQALMAKGMPKDQALAEAQQIVEGQDQNNSSTSSAAA